MSDACAAWIVEHDGQIEMTTNYSITGVSVDWSNPNAICPVTSRSVFSFVPRKVSPSLQDKDDVLLSAHYVTGGSSWGGGLKSGYDSLERALSSIAASLAGPK